MKCFQAIHTHIVGGTLRTRDWKGLLKKEAYGSGIKISMPWRTGPGTPSGDSEAPMNARPLNAARSQDRQCRRERQSEKRGGGYEWND